MLLVFSPPPGVAPCLYRSEDVPRRYLFWGWALQGEKLGVNISA